MKMTGMRNPRWGCWFNGRSLFFQVPNRHFHRNSNKVISLALHFTACRLADRVATA
jgi:hypothetical protein